MFTIEEAATSVGLSERQLRRRLEATAPVLAPFIRRGEKNRLLLDAGAVEILRAVEDRRRAGVTLEDAVAFVAQGIGEKHGGEDGRATGQPIGKSAPDASTPLVEELRERVRFLERENERLWGLVGDLRALPAPREEPRRPWISRLLRPLISTRP